jgi:anti-sigma regulatory factor (Ser/Thr protein kinase)
LAPPVQPGSLRDPSGFEASLRSTPEAPRAARECVNRFADRLPAAILADVRMVVSELVTNCVVHGTGAQIELAIDVTEAGFVRGTVTDGGTGPVAVSAPRRPGEGGFGLRIVETLVSRWGVNAPSSDIWFEFSPAS